MPPSTAGHPAHRVLDHPLAAHHLAVLRDRRSGPEQFRAAARRLSALLDYIIPGLGDAGDRLYGTL